MRSIRLENVTKSFNNDLILENINLTIPAGKFFALLGPSGSGKTTLLRLIGGFEQVDSGKIFLDDEDITDMPIHLRRINTVFQSYAHAVAKRYASTPASRHPKGYRSPFCPFWRCTTR